MPDRRYLSDQRKFLDHAYAALAPHFSDRQAFDTFYSAISNNERKNEFLRVASFYRFLVKHGDWHVQIDGSPAIIDYLTNSFKLVALFSLIESISVEKHTDFHLWLRNRDAAITFPIVDKSSLSRLHDDYKASFGSIRRCVTFFQSLSNERQTALCRAITIEGTPLPTIEKVAQFLYKLRSEFVHDAQLALHVTRGPMHSMKKNKIMRTTISLDDLLTLFEEGFLTWFGR